MFCNSQNRATVCVPAADDEDDDDEEEEDDLLRKTGNFVASSDSLPGGILRVSKPERPVSVNSAPCW